MLNKIIKKLEEAKKYQIPHIEAGIEMAIEIIKNQEIEFDRHPLSDEDIEKFKLDCMSWMDNEISKGIFLDRFNQILALNHPQNFTEPQLQEMYNVATCNDQREMTFERFKDALLTLPPHKLGK